MGVLERRVDGAGRRHYWGISSANPRRLSDYSSLGVSLSGDLVTAAASVAGAADQLDAADDPAGRVPSMGAVADALTNLAADWRHLDGFVGAVGRAFAVYVDPAWRGDRSTVVDRSVTAFDLHLSRLGRIGPADRDEATGPDHPGAQPCRD